MTVQRRKHSSAERIPDQEAIRHCLRRTGDLVLEPFPFALPPDQFRLCCDDCARELAPHLSAVIGRAPLALRDRLGAVLALGRGVLLDLALRQTDYRRIAGRSVREGRRCHSWVTRLFPRLFPR